MLTLNLCVMRRYCLGGRGPGIHTHSITMVCMLHFLFIHYVDDSTTSIASVFYSLAVQYRWSTDVSFERDKRRRGGVFALLARGFEKM